MHTYILLDRSGSMETLWTEALGAVNGYVETLGKEAAEAGLVTLAVFDAQGGLDFAVLRRGVAPSAWAPVTAEDATPRGMTPLFDAIGRIVALADADAPARALIAIMTDGLENASREMTRDSAKAALDRVQEKGWQVIFLGADFATFTDADRVGVVAAKRMAIKRGNMDAAFQTLARKTGRYAHAGEDIDFQDEDRAEAGESEVKKT